MKRAITGPHCIQKLQLKDTAVQAVFGPQHLKWRASLGIHTPSSHECAHVLMPGREPPRLSAQPWVSSPGTSEPWTLHPVLIFPSGWPVVSAQ